MKKDIEDILYLINIQQEEIKSMGIITIAIVIVNLILLVIIVLSLLKLFL